jgi:hypothetical protein
MAKGLSTKKRLEALRRAQQLNEMLKLGGMQSQALLDSAGESRPSDEDHVANLLQSEKFTTAGASRRGTGRKRRSAGRKAKSARKKRR